MGNSSTERSPIAESFRDDDLWQAEARSAADVSRAVTPSQLALLESALRFRRSRGHWPTAIKLARAADATLPVVWSELKSLQAVGCVEWKRTVRVVKMPTGLFFLAQNTERPFSSVLPRGCVPEAECTGVAQ